MMPRAFAPLALLILAASSPPAGAAPGPDVPVGAARVDVTPDGPVRLSGYLARNEESRGVGQKVWAKALAIGSDEQGAAVLVSLDSLGVSAAIVAEVAGRLEKKAGLRPDRLAVGASHTHYAPCLTGVAPNIFGKTLPPDEQGRIEAYTRTLVDRLERVCLDALAARRPPRADGASARPGSRKGTDARDRERTAEIARRQACGDGTRRVIFCAREARTTGRKSCRRTKAQSGRSRAEAGRRQAPTQTRRDRQIPGSRRRLLQRGQRQGARRQARRSRQHVGQVHARRAGSVRRCRRREKRP